MATLRNWKMGNFLNLVFDKEIDGCFIPNGNTDLIIESLDKVRKFYKIDNWDDFTRHCHDGMWDVYVKETGEKVYNYVYNKPFKWYGYWEGIDDNKYRFKLQNSDERWTVNLKNLDDIVDGEENIYLIDFKGNVLFIFAEEPEWISPTERMYRGGKLLNLDDKVLTALRNGKIKLVLSNIEEGGGDINLFFDCIYESIKAFDLPAELIYIIHGNHNVEELYDEYCIKNNIINKIHVYKSEYLFEIISKSMQMNIGRIDKLGYEIKNLTEEEVLENLDRDKKFILLNRNAYKPHRFYLLSKLNEMGALDDSYFSCLFNNEGTIKYDNYLEPILSENDFIKDLPIMEAFQNLGSVKIPEERTQLANLKEFFDVFANTDHTLFKNSYFSIVSETCFEDNSAHLTEKTCKALYYFHPFIVVGGYKHLHHLKERGFKTFDKWIDESYDLIKDPKERMKAVLKEIEKINNIETLKKIYIESFDILKHNHDMYMDLKNKSFLSKILVQIAND